MMKLPVRSNRPAGPRGSRQAFQGGTYSLAVTAIVLAILVVVNILVSLLPTSMTWFDMSATQLYSVTSSTKSVVSALEQDVTIYWIVQADKEDRIIENLLSRYDSLSDHITVEKKNPDIYPTFAAQYTDETVGNNSLIVVSGDKSRLIGTDDIYLYEPDLYSYSYSSFFDGEGAITSAIDYVVSDQLPQLYLLEGHGEGELPQTFLEQLEKDNIETQTLSLLTVDAIPEQADCLMIYAPASDISAEEKQMLADYLSGGGKLLVAAGPAQGDSLDNLNSLLADCGVTVEEGILVEGDREHYAFQTPLFLMPDLAESEITTPLMEESYFPILPVAAGLTLSQQVSGITVTQLLTTSEASYSKLAGYEMTDYGQEEGDPEGPFAVAVSAQWDSGGELAWFSSSLFLEDLYNSYSSGANVNLAMNALSQLVGEREAMAIRSKSLDYNYLTISDSTASLLKAVMIGVFPLAYLAVGIGVVVRRRRLQHEPV